VSRASSGELLAQSPQMTYECYVIHVFKLLMRFTVAFKNENVSIKRFLGHVQTRRLLAVSEQILDPKESGK